MTLPRVPQTSFGSGELSPALYSRYDLAKFDSGVKLAENVYVLKQGGFLKRPGLRFVCEVKDSSAEARLVGFEFNVEQAYVLEFGNLYMRVIRNGGLVLTDDPKTITAITADSPGEVTSVAHGFSNGTEGYLVGVAGPTGLNGRTLTVRNVTTDTFTLEDEFGAAIDTTSLPAYVSGGTFEAVFELVTPWTTADIAEFDFVASNDTLYVVHPGHLPQKITRTGHSAWTIAAMTFTADQAAPTSLVATTTGSGSDVNEYVVTAINEVTGEESLPSSSDSDTADLTLAGTFITLTWVAAAGADQYRVYKKENGVFRYAGFTTELTFVDDNINPDDNDTPPTDTSLFAAPGDYPGAVSFYEQRLSFAYSTNEPKAFWLSRSESIENFSESVISQANDAIIGRLSGQHANRIRYLIEFNELFFVTSGSERSIRGSDGFLTPANGERSKISERGSAAIKPLVIGDALLFVQRDGETVREKVFAGYDGQGQSRYEDRELTIMAEHLFRERQVKRWAYAQAPDSLVVCASSDSMGLFLTYHREHDLWGWGRFLPGGSGQIDDTVAIPEGRYNTHYVIVKRTINGQTKRYIERFAERYITDVADAFFVDSGLSYDSTPATVFGGLWHLEGETVVALADGAVSPELVVSGGSITLAQAASKVSAGLAYAANIETLPIHMNLKATGTTTGVKKRIPSVTIGMRDTLGLQIGPDADNLTDLIERTNEDVPALVTGDREAPISPQWGARAGVYLRSPDPLPMEITAIVPEIAVGG